MSERERLVLMRRWSLALLAWLVLMPMAKADGISFSLSAASPTDLLKDIRALLPQPSQMQLSTAALLPEYGEVIAADFSPDGHYLALETVLGDARDRVEVHLWNVVTQRLAQTLYLPPDASVEAIAAGLRWSPDGRVLAACIGRTGDGTVALLWHGKAGHLLPGPVLRADGTATCSSLTFSADGRQLLLALDRARGEPGDRLLALDTASGLRAWGIALNDDFHAQALALAPDGQQIAVGGRQADRAERVLLMSPAAQQVTNVFTAWPDQALMPTLLWDASGTQLDVLLRWDDGTGTLMVHDARSGALLDTLTGTLDVAQAPDYRVRTEPGLALMQSRSGRQLPITGIGSGMVRVSPQGDFLALPDTTGVIVLKVARGWFRQEKYAIRDTAPHAVHDTPPAGGRDTTGILGSISNMGNHVQGLNAPLAYIVFGLVFATATIAQGVEYVQHAQILPHGTRESAGSDTGSIRDCNEMDSQHMPVCPLMLRVPAGNVVIGAPDGKGDDSEHPRHTVKIKALAVGMYPVTRGEYLACVAAKACLQQGNSEFRQDNSHPVVMVNYKDASNYVAWLSLKTGKHYRLPSEAEWEYLARGGAATAYPWGDDIGSKNAVCGDCGSKWDNFSTAPAGSFKPNAFGLFDVVGNVWQWTADCYHPNYQGAPVDGSPWGGTACELRPIRGGAWNEMSSDSRLSARRGVYPHTRNYDMGFRVVRDIN